jgi:site-specific DNA-methyltransferase (adenine-specific)
VVLDPYMGSGTAGLACINAGLPFTGVDIEPRYFDHACRRIEAAWRERKAARRVKAAA